MHIMTKDGWKLLKPKCQNQIWEIAIWDETIRKIVPHGTGRLHFMGMTDHIEEAPPMYKGKIPSAECELFLKRLDKEHVEWTKKREAM